MIIWSIGWFQCETKWKETSEKKWVRCHFFHEDEIPFDIIHAKGYCTESEYLSIFVTELHLIWLWVLMTNSLLATMFTIVKKMNHKKIVIDLKYKLYAQIWAEKNENIHMRLKCIYLNRYSFVGNTEKFLLSI